MTPSLTNKQSKHVLMGPPLYLKSLGAPKLCRLQIFKIFWKFKGPQTFYLKFPKIWPPPNFLKIPTGSQGGASFFCAYGSPRVYSLYLRTSVANQARPVSCNQSETSIFVAAGSWQLCWQSAISLQRYTRLKIIWAFFASHCRVFVSIAKKSPLIKAAKLVWPLYESEF